MFLPSARASIIAAKDKGDHTPPTVPTGLISSGVGASSFTLAWDASTDAVGVTGYEVFQDGVSCWTGAGLSAPIGSLSSSTAYSMTVRATDAAGNWSAQSTPLVVTTGAPSVNYGTVNMSPRSGSAILPTPPDIFPVAAFSFTISGDTGSFGSGNLVISMANETTQTGYQTIAIDNVSGTFSRSFYQIVNTAGNYTVQAKLTVSGHDSWAWSVSGGFVCLPPA